MVLFLNYFHPCRDFRSKDLPEGFLFGFCNTEAKQNHDLCFPGILVRIWFKAQLWPIKKGVNRPPILSFVNSCSTVPNPQHHRPCVYFDSCMTNHTRL